MLVPDGFLWRGAGVMLDVSRTECLYGVCYAIEAHVPVDRHCKPLLQFPF